MAADFIDYIEMGSEFNEVRPWDGTASRVEPGDYEVVVKSAVPGQSKQGNSQLEVTYEVVDGPMKGRTVRKWYPTKRNSPGVSRLKALTVAAGVPTDDRGGFAISALLNSHLMITVTEREYPTTDATTGQAVMRTTADVQGERAIEQPQARPPARPAANQRR
jgi:hypothetical protein